MTYTLLVTGYDSLSYRKGLPCCVKAGARSFTRGIDSDVGPLETKTDDRDMQLIVPLPDMMAISCRSGAVQSAGHNAIALDAGVYNYEVVEGCEQLNDQRNGINNN